MTHDLTDRQRDCLNAIASHIDEHGFPPTFREIARLIGLKGSGTNAVSELLHRLETKGYIRTRHMKSRAITVLKRVEGGA